MTFSSALAAVNFAFEAEKDAAHSVSREIERFLDGETDGGPLFHALYDDIAEEPIPESLLAVLRNRC